MRIIDLSVAIFALIVVITVSTPAQMRSPLNAPIDPFNITKGRSFSASGGGNVPAAESAERISRISADILEAQKIISGNYVESKSSKLSDNYKNAIDGMLRSLDPHSSFYDPAEWKDLLDDQQSGYTGIGATISNFERSGVSDTYILSTFPGSSAARAQLNFGDKIVAINGVKMAGKESELVRSKLRGPNGTTLRVTVEKNISGKLETVELRRSRVSQPSIPDAYIIRPGIGYIDLSEGFNYTTSDEMDVALRELKRQGMSSLVLDLRGNGGGIVDQAVKVAEKFLPAGRGILSQRGRSRIDNRSWSSSNRTPEKMPLVVLVDEDTASASEIVAGAFQDDDRALIVGEKTFGKGLVQSVISLPNRTGLTLTAARYLTPSGRSIQRDYSKLSFYDYFSHKGTVEAIDKPYFEARTITDRKVYGGDGIQPDEIVARPELTSRQIAMIDPIFFFAREIAGGRISGTEQLRTPKFNYGGRVLPGHLLIGTETITKFSEFVALSSWAGIKGADVTKEREFLPLRLRYYLAMSGFGVVSANQVIIEDDIQLAKAIAALPRASQLANLADSMRKVTTR